MQTALVDGTQALPIWSIYIAVAIGGVAGASHAAKRGFDVIGVIGLAISGGLGGLLIRDILLQKGTPVVLTDPRYLFIATLAALYGFFFAGLIARTTSLLLTLDALALGLFVTLGASAAFHYQLGMGAAIFLGVITAIGGGILRDLLSGEPPAVLRPGVLAGVAALAGSIIFAFLTDWGWGIFWSQIITIAVVFALRILALRRGWESPTSSDLTARLWDFWAQARHPVVRSQEREGMHGTGLIPSAAITSEITAQQSAVRDTPPEDR